ncbi:flp operon protein C [Aggregatibacter actinomycetemcomitans]|uniref:flp operon protein C n=1 Tax=Aggregatibacter actinomycetemcomitans TaxID=714 RepID=UPI0011D6224C|nr:flp operon protein C [Aggregatibacter actinomycetemcomitans]QEH47051.1 flp operon protein C [Aggregatibacter actinomycetemcomitans]TYA49860.1 flp operon protein C [Aggregatibacter actinomycetemcomitans]
MNYRTLLIISVLTLAVGIGGIMFTPAFDNTENQQTIIINNQSVPEAEKKPEKLILTAELKNDVSKGHLLQADDYILNEISVPEDSTLVDNDLREATTKNGIQGLQGYLMAENVRAGSFLSNKSIISPNDPRFFTSSLNPNQEVAYRIYVRSGDDYILNTILSGDYVSVYSQQIASDSRNTYDRKDLVKVLGKAVVLQARNFAQVAEQGTEAEKALGLVPNSEVYAGYVALKITAEQAKKFYSLDRESKLVILPVENNTQEVDSRGVFIRKLRGQ